MKKEDELKMKLDEVYYQFKEEKYDLALMSLEKAGKLIITSLNAYNKKH